MTPAEQPAARTVVLLAGHPAPWLDDGLRRAYDVVALPPDEPSRTAVLAREGDRVDVLAVTGATGVDDALLAALPRLGLVANLGVGYDNVDVAAAHRRGVIVSNTPDVLTDAVAELTVGLALATVRRLAAADRYVRDGRWAADGAFPLTGQLGGSRVGVLGLGRIGRAVAERLSGFGCVVAYHSRREVAGVPYRYAGSPRALAASVDVLVVTVPAGAETHRIVDRAVLEALGPDGVLVNVARGSVVDEAALVELLVEGRLGGAGLDVYVDEPHVPEALLGLDSVVLLPHVGSATVPTRRAMADLVLANVAAFVRTGSAVTPVEPA